MMKMYKYKEFAPHTYLNLTDDLVTFSVNGLLKWLITNLILLLMKTGATINWCLL